jgi:hypothetical protein
MITGHPSRTIGAIISRTQQLINKDEVVKFYFGRSDRPVRRKASVDTQNRPLMDT